MTLTGETIKRLLENGKKIILVAGQSEPQSVESDALAVAVSNYPITFPA